MAGEQFLAPYYPRLASASTILIGFSGGLDSTVLLHACARELPRSKLRALHVNHGLSPNSDYWQEHCQSFCRQLGITLYSRPVAVSSRGRGIERAAREARYQCFEELVGLNDILLLAHHKDDQAETVLYRLLRGSGPKGLQGMPEFRPLGEGHLLRPLLDYSRSDLELYARHHQLKWIEDESNTATRFDRNYLRHQIVPLLAERWPDYQQRILRSAQQCESAQLVLDERGREDLAALDVRQERVGFSLSLGDVFQNLTLARQKNLLRCWVDSLRLEPCGHSIIDSVLSDLLSARRDASPLVSWSGGSFRRFKNRLYLLPVFGSPWPIKSLNNSSQNAPNDVVRYVTDNESIDVRFEDDYHLPVPGGFNLSFSAVEGPGALRITPQDNVEIGFRQGGERCRPSGRYHSAPLKKLLQEAQLEPWLRDLAPLVYINGELAAVADIFICAGFECASGESGVAPSWQFQQPQGLK